MQNGVDVILAQKPSWSTQRIALLTNDAARTNNGIISRKALIENGFNIQKLFSPEHGIDTKGADGMHIDHQIDPITLLPIVSLYGKQLYPNAKDVEDIDIMLFDIPDAGTRFYTYLWSMTYWIQAAASFQKPVFILDRPNPLGGAIYSLAEGPYLSPNISSFIGRFNIPIKHQMTLGELANYFNQTLHWKANLEIIKCHHWDRSLPYSSIDLAQNWIATSPALKTWNACLLYPGLCFFEATNVSVARTSSYSFEWIGAQWLDTKKTLVALQVLLKDDLIIQLHENGLSLKVIDPNSYQSVFTGLIILKMIKDLHPAHFDWQHYPTNVNPTGENHLSLLLGIENAELLFDLPFDKWFIEIQKEIRVKNWFEKVKSYLLY